MAASSSLTLLDLAFSVLVENDQPLSAREIAQIAGEAGYSVSPDAIEFELDEYIQESLGGSPIIPIGYDQYGLLARKPQAQASRFNLTAAAGLIVVISLLVIGLWRLSPSIKENLSSDRLGGSVGTGSLEQSSEALSPAASVSLVDVAWWSANAINQLNNDTQRIATKFLSNPYNTCGPAVLAVITNFWRAQSEASVEPVTAGEVIKSARNQLGYFYPPYNSGLLDFKGLRAIGGLFGLVQAYPEDHRSLITVEELLARVQSGEPAIVGMRYHYQGPDRLYLPAGGSGVYNHFVIVFEAHQENEEIRLRVYNPHPGYYLTDDGQAAPSLITLDEFIQSWTLNDGSELSQYGYAGFFQLSP